MQATHSDKLLKVHEVAEFLNCSNATVWRLNASGTLPAPVRLGRATRWVQSEIIAFVDSAKDPR